MPGAGGAAATAQIHSKSRAGGAALAPQAESSPRAGAQGIALPGVCTAGSAQTPGKRARSGTPRPAGAGIGACTVPPRGHRFQRPSVPTARARDMSTQHGPSSPTGTPPAASPGPAAGPAGSTWPHWPERPGGGERQESSTESRLPLRARESSRQRQARLRRAEPATRTRLHVRATPACRGTLHARPVRGIGANTHRDVPEGTSTNTCARSRGIDCP